jgi:hypothetical protein
MYGEEEEMMMNWRSEERVKSEDMERKGRSSLKDQLVVFQAILKEGECYYSPREPGGR